MSKRYAEFVFVTIGESGHATSVVGEPLAAPFLYRRADTSPFALRAMAGQGGLPLLQAIGTASNVHTIKPIVQIINSSGVSMHTAASTTFGRALGHAKQEIAAACIPVALCSLRTAIAVHTATTTVSTVGVIPGIVSITIAKAVVLPVAGITCRAAAAI